MTRKRPMTRGLNLTRKIQLLDRFRPQGLGNSVPNTVGGGPDATGESRLTQPSDGHSLLESLSDSKISILYLARQAKEAKDNVLAKELTAQGQSLRTEITRLRRRVTPEWNKTTKALIVRAGTAQSELAKLIQDADKSAKKMRVFTRALTAASNILALAKKVL